MFMPKYCPLMAVIFPIWFFLTVSFFVLFTLRKVTDKWLKVLGYAAVSFLLLAALVVFSGAVVNSAKDFDMMRCPMAGKMKKGDMMQMMRNKNMPEMAMPEEKLPPRE
ncbi:MAG: hypothetical protein M0R17_10035 [Candidatus Omnitrophica bacterium]|jgi:fumarate reductase subunit C|nr:hypothetical protein [Candidatus Omnitrophota bacterium]